MRNRALIFIFASGISKDPMNIITVTSDWCEHDYYLPVLMGKICCLLPDSKVVNLTNSVKAFNIPQACFILRHSYKNFPTGTIHLLAVNSEPSAANPMVAVKYNGHWFVFPDDGRFALLADPVQGELPKAYKLPQGEEDSTFRAGGLFARAAARITEGRIEAEGEAYLLKPGGQDIPAVLEDRIIGRVVYIDSYGNAITNISKETFARGYITWKGSHEEDPDFVIYVQGPYLKLYNIYNTYGDVQNGGTVAFFNSAGLLELAINSGNFAQVEGIDTTAEVMIKFS